MFSQPLPFKEALASFAARDLMPTAAGSAEIAQLAPEIRERAFFSAKVEDARFLASADRMIGAVVSGEAGRGSVEGRKSALSPDEVRGELKELLRATGYAPELGKEGGLEDLSSTQRLNLIIKTNNDMAAGAGQFAIQNDPELLDFFPCLELYRLESREKERNWQERWVRKGGKLFGGRMIARKDDRIWRAISAFGNPYPPFDYNSGMWTEEVSRAEAEALGVISRSSVVKPQSLSFNENVSVDFPQNISNGLSEVLKGLFKVVANQIILEAKS